VSKVLKAKYYPGASFLESELGNRPSFAWRSIWNAKSLLKQGLMWRVGDGASVHIWHDRWIPKPSTYSIQSPIRCLDSEAKVSALIDTDTMWWNIPLIQEIFMKEEAELICSIPNGFLSK
jgi:hypothetical protein